MSKIISFLRWSNESRPQGPGRRWVCRKKPTGTLPTGWIAEGGHHDDRCGVPLGVESFQQVETRDARHAKIRDDAVAGVVVPAFDEGLGRSEINGMEAGGFQTFTEQCAICKSMARPLRRVHPENATIELSCSPTY